MTSCTRARPSARHRPCDVGRSCCTRRVSNCRGEHRRSRGCDAEIQRARARHLPGARYRSQSRYMTRRIRSWRSGAGAPAASNSLVLQGRRHSRSRSVAPACRSRQSFGVGVRCAVTPSEPTLASGEPLRRRRSLRKVKRRTSRWYGSGSTTMRLPPTPHPLPSALTKPISSNPRSRNQRRIVGRRSATAVPRPDHRRPRFAQRGEPADHGLDIFVRGMADDPADEDEIGRHCLPHRGGRRIVANDVDPAGRVGCRPLWPPRRCGGSSSTSRPSTSCRRRWSRVRQEGPGPGRRTRSPPGCDPAVGG